MWKAVDGYPLSDGHVIIYNMVTAHDESGISNYGRQPLTNSASLLYLRDIPNLSITSGLSANLRPEITDQFRQCGELITLDVINIWNRVIIYPGRGKEVSGS